MAKYGLTNNGAVGAPFPRSPSETVGMLAYQPPGPASSGVPIYYGQAADPWYKITGCLYDSQLNVSFHAPNQAKFSATPGNDQSISIYDVVQGIIIEAYGFNGSVGMVMPDASSCPGSGSASCAVQVPNLSGCQAERAGIDSDRATTHYTVTINGNTYTLGGASASGPFSSLAAHIRQNEFMSGQIDHAIQAGTYCANPNFYVFPSTGGLGKCTANVANSPPPGALIFTDYTPAQISSMLSAGQISRAQSIILTTMSTYGSYLLVTGGPTWAGMALGGEFVEGQDAYVYYGITDPLVAWACANGMNDYGMPGCSGGVYSGSNYYPSLNSLGGIPLETGPEGKDTSGRSCSVAPGCDVGGHIHIADPCIAKGYLGQTGGCQ